MRTDIIRMHDRCGTRLRAVALVMFSALAFCGSSRAQDGTKIPPNSIQGASAAVSTAPTTKPSTSIAATAGPAPIASTTVTTTVTKVDGPGTPAVMHTDLPADLSVRGMFDAADTIVKAVMALLALASVATWSIFIYKFIELSSARSRAAADLRAIAATGSLANLSKSIGRGPIARLVRSAELEMEASESLPADGVKERVSIALQRVESAAARRISAGTGVLASIGSTGPFVGLFGTVWGIMNSFIHISNAHTTNLSVVAPGIAEALLATAMGLVAAIPAVVIYNMFSRAITAYRALLGDASAGIMRHVSRDLDRFEQVRYAKIAAE